MFIALIISNPRSLVLRIINNSVLVVKQVPECNVNILMDQGVARSLWHRGHLVLVLVCAHYISSSPSSSSMLSNPTSS